MFKKPIAESDKNLRLENEELQVRLNESEATLDAIRKGEVDAVFVTSDDGEKIFSLTSAETPYRIILEEMNEGAAIIMADGTILYCNRRFTEFVSVHMEIAIGSNFLKLFPELEQVVSDKLKKTWKNANCEEEVCHVTDAGETRNLQLSFSPLSSSIEGDVCVLVSDITELKNKETQLLEASNILEKRVEERTLELRNEIAQRREMEIIIRESEERHRKAQEIGHVGSWEYNIKTNEFWGSEEGKRIYGFDSGKDLFNAEEVMKCVIERERVDQALIDLIEKEQPYDIVFEIIQSNTSSKRTIHSIAQLVRDNHGKPIKVSGMLHDITERKLAEEEIQRKNGELERLNAEKDKFFSIIAHDLRSPFTNFLGFTRMMVEDLPKLRLEEIQTISLSMRRSATNLYQLLENLLEWSVMQRGLSHFEPSAFLLLPFVSENFMSISESADNKGIEFIIDIANNIEVHADRNMLLTIIGNLAGNAVKFTRKGGKVIISAHVFADNGNEISIKDSGIGMNKKIIDNLFRLDRDSGRKGTDGEPSTGLGLIICKDFIEKHCGRLWAESEEGKGSTFYFTIPGVTSPISSK